MSKWPKIVFFTLLLMGAGYFFGRVCDQLEIAYVLILLPTTELVTLFLKFLIALVVLLVAAGLVAALLRPVSLGYVAFVLSGLVLLIGWGISIPSGALSLIYVLAGIIYTMGVNREMKERIRFSVHPIRAGQMLLSMSLLLAVCGSLYLGYKEHIDREGFSIPEPYIEIILAQMEKQIKIPESEGEGELVVAEFRETIKQNIEDLIYEKVMPYEAFIPLGLSVGVFMSLITITGFLMWLPSLCLRIIFYLLKILGVITIVRQMREVEVVVID